MCETNIEELIKYLARQTKKIVDIRYNNGHFCVMCSCGNFMSVVRGTQKKTIHEAIETAILRWDNRNEQNPF